MTAKKKQHNLEKRNEHKIWNKMACFFQLPVDLLYFHFTFIYYFCDHFGLVCIGIVLTLTRRFKAAREFVSFRL